MKKTIATFGILAAFAILFYTGSPPDFMHRDMISEVKASTDHATLQTASIHSTHIHKAELHQFIAEAPVVDIPPGVRARECDVVSTLSPVMCIVLEKNKGPTNRCDGTMEVSHPLKLLIT